MKATHLKLIAPGDTGSGGAWLSQIGRRVAPPDVEPLRAAVRFASEQPVEARALPSGEPALVHAIGAASVLLDPRLDQARVISAQWGDAAGSAFAVDIEIEAASRSNLARAIWEALAREKIRVLATRLAASDTVRRMRITLGVGGLGQLRRVLLQLQDIPGVARAGRR